jgi:hypothetical protein
MLRALLLALLGANLLFLTWAQGWLGEPQRGEPQRLANQVRPEWVQVLPWQTPGRPAPAAAGAPSSAAASAELAAGDTACLEAGPLNEAGLPFVLQLVNLPEGSWSVDADGVGQLWLRVPAADAALAQRLLTLTGMPPDRAFRPCRVP